MQEFNKLVRDKIPDIIRVRGEIPVTRTLDETEYLTELERKLIEECGEYISSKRSEELADILEVVYALAEARGCSVGKLNEIYDKKHADRGGFERRIFLVCKE